MRPLAVLPPVLCTLATLVPAQVTWVQRLEAPQARDSHVAAYDPVEGRTLVYGGLRNGVSLAESRLWDGLSWIRLPDAGAPPERHYAQGCPDVFPGSLLVFGGRSTTGAARGDLWRYRNGSWIQVGSSPTSPTARWVSAMALDPGRGRAVLYGGYDPARGVLADTWEWDGNTWTQRAPATSPGQRSNHAMTYDPVRGRVLLYGGYRNGSLADLWAFDGSNWSDVTPFLNPFQRHNTAITFDTARRRLVMFGGKDGSTLFDDTWEYDGTRWFNFSLSTKPSPRELHSLTYDAARRRVVLVGGVTANGSSDETWEWDGSVWRPRTVWNAPTPRPSPRIDAGAAYDESNQEMVVFGGDPTGSSLNGETWVYDGQVWNQVTPAGNPGSRRSHAMAYDPPRRRVLLFGGERYAPFQFANDLWQWDGVNRSWTQVATAAGPGVRRDTAMAFDRTRNRLVLFGGFSGSAYLNDTWEFDGTTWTQVTMTSPPGRRARHALAYDEARGRVVLHGGFDGVSLLHDTFEWMGTYWRRIFTVNNPTNVKDPALAFDRVAQCLVVTSQLTTYELRNDDWVSAFQSPQPPMAYGQRMVYDTRRKSLLVFGGQDMTPGNYFADVWERKAGVWSQHERRILPPRRGDHVMAADPLSRELILFGGRDGDVSFNDTWIFEAEHWGLLAPTYRPSPRSAMAMVAEPAASLFDHQLVMTGGIGADGTFLGDTWLWRSSGFSWIQSIAQLRPARCNHAMARDPLTGRALVFGGSIDRSTKVNDLQVFDGMNWKTRAVAGAPAARDTHAMAYDEQRRVVVLFGGSTPTGTALGDTWEYDGFSWNQRQPGSAPTPRWNHTMSYDRARGRVVLFGGYDPARGFMNDAWEWDGTTWASRAALGVPPAAVENPAAAYDPNRGRTMVFGGNGKGGANNATHEYFAPADAGTLHPHASHRQIWAGSPPVLGSTLRVESTTPAGSVSVIFVAGGPSNRTILDVPAPLACGGSALHVDLATAIGLPFAGGSLAVDLPLELADGAGASLSFQVLSLLTRGSCFVLTEPLVVTLRSP